MAAIGAESGFYEEDSAWSAWCRSVDHAAVFACVLLFAVGVVLAFAASPALALRNDLPAFHYAWRQLSFGAPAFILLFGLSFLSASGVRTIGALAFAVGFACLALLPFFGVSHGKEAVRWFSIYGLSVQPTEIVKPGLVVVSALLLTALRHSDRAVALGAAAASFLCLAATVGLLGLQPDFGQSALIVAVWGALFFAAGGSVMLLSAVGGLMALGASLAYASAPHFAARVDAFLDPLGAGHPQIQAAEAAIVNGGWFGRGLGEGVEKQALPDAHTDFILAVAAEEYGFAMVAFVILIFAGLVLRAASRLWRSEDDFTRLAGLGLALLIGGQAAVHVAVSAQMAPVTGMTLPFVSYGGTSLLASGAAMGLLLALTRRRPREYARLFERSA